MDAELQKVIEERKKEAREKDIRTKAHRIAEQMGWFFFRGDGILGYKFRNYCFVIEVSSGAMRDSDGSVGYSETVIAYYSTVVFGESGYNIDSFIPGHWEKEFEVLNDRAIQKSQKQIEMAREEISWRQAEADQKERQKWGL